MQERIEASGARYIKLGPGGAWEDLCLREGTLRFGHREIPHGTASSGDRTLIRAHFIDMGCEAGVASDKTREVMDFFDGDESVVWITFHGGSLWWCYAAAEVVDLGADNDTGARLRRTLGGWRSHSIGGVPLLISELSGRLTRTAAYRKTTCRIVDAFDYLMARLNDDEMPEVAAVKSARAALVQALVVIIQRLTWQDFELLVDLVFAGSGWRRTSIVGGTPKTIDIALELPSTGETAFVQVKSATSHAEFKSYEADLAARPETRMFFVYHTGPADLAAATLDVTVIGPQRVAEMALNAGVVDWLIRRAS